MISRVRRDIIISTTTARRAKVYREAAEAERQWRREKVPIIAYKCCPFPSVCAHLRAISRAAQL